MSHIFISYSSKNRDFALKLADHLEQFYAIWIDREGIEGGMEWEKTIEKALTDCAVFIVVISPESNESDWVARETILAEQLQKARIPILFAGRLPFRLLNLHYIDFQGTFDGGLRDLLEALHAYLQPQDKTQAAVNQLLAEALRAHLKADYAQANSYLGQALAIESSLAPSVEAFWQALKETSRADYASRFKAQNFIKEETKLLHDARYGTNQAYEWSIYLDLDAAILDEIDYVEYELHPSFLQPLRIVRDRQSQFRLTMIGWGIFNIPVKLYFKDGTMAASAYHLRFEVD